MIFDLGAPGVPPLGGAPKSKFLEIRQVWCLSLRFDAYCSAETFFWETDPHGARGIAPKGTPNGAPPDFHRNTYLYGIDRFVSMHSLNLQHSSGEPTIITPGSTKRQPKWAPSLGTYSTSVLVRSRNGISTRAPSCSSCCCCCCDAVEKSLRLS